jgi:hypothetical protein
MPQVPSVIQVDKLSQSSSSTNSSHYSNQEPPSMKMIGVQGQFTTKSSGSREETNFRSKFCFKHK